MCGCGMVDERNAVKHLLYDTKKKNVAKILHFSYGSAKRRRTIELLLIRRYVYVERT